MYAKNNFFMKRMHQTQEIPKYTIKRVSAGVASVLIGTSLYCLGAGEILADQSPSQVATTVTTSTAPQIGDVQTIATDKVSNGSFDGNYTSNKTDWETKTGGNAELVTTPDQSSAKINAGTSDDHVLQKIATTPGTNYDLTADVTIDSDDVSTGMYLTAKSVVENEQGPVLNQVAISGTKGQTQQVKCSFTATTPETWVGLVKWSETPDAKVTQAAASLDNVHVLANEQYELVWQDEFSGQQLDQSKWGYELGNIRGNEQEHYTDSNKNVYLQDGNLVLQVTDRNKEDQYVNPRPKTNGRPVIYDSGSVRTAGKVEFLYGRLEMRAKLPKGKGAFPAFWTLGADFTLDGDIAKEQGYGWPSTGELDIMELIGAPTAQHPGEVAEGDQSNRKVYGTPHFYYEKGDADKDGSYKPYALSGNLALNEDFYDKYHTFGIDWSPDKIEWYVDGVVYNTMPLTGDERLEAAKACFNKPQYIQLNLATGGNWAGNAGLELGKDQTKFMVDYVRYYQTPAQKAAAQAYYAEQPQLIGVKDLVIQAGKQADLLQNISVDRVGYTVDFSIDDEYMFENAGGNTNVTLQVGGKAEQEKISQLKPGVYNIYYSALPTEFEASGTPTKRIARKQALLTILPDKELSGRVGASLASVKLPQGFSWADENKILGDKKSYLAYFSKGNNTRRVAVELPVVVSQKEDTKVEMTEMDKTNTDVSMTQVDTKNTETNNTLIDTKAKKASSLAKNVAQTEKTLPQTGESTGVVAVLLGMASFLGSLLAWKKMG